MMLDLAIIGSGPAALTAAIYAARAGLSVEVFEKSAIGGALSQISKIENYPGFVGSGADLAATLKQQAQQFGAKIQFGEVKTISKRGSGAKIAFTLQIDDGEEVVSRSVLVATGSEPKPLETTTKTPISYCALCDGALYKEKNIAVIGGGNSAIQESLHLASLVKSLTLFSHSPLKAEPYLIEKLKNLPNVKIQENREPTSAELDAFDGVFVFIGKRPATTFLPPEILTEQGFIKTENHETSISGLFAAGDVREGSVKQAITAAADGAAAAIEIINFLKKEQNA